MTLTLLIAALSVGLGIAVGWIGTVNTPYIRPIQTFALTAALAVVLVQLLPEAMAHLGIAGLGAFVMALAIPTLLEWVYTNVIKATHHHEVDDHRVGLELAFAGLAIHQFGDGLALGTYVATAKDHVPITVLVALSLHSVPVVALATLACRTRLGERAAILRGMGFLAATAAGIGVFRLVPEYMVHRYAPWATAAMSGLLVHIVAHDFPRKSEVRLGNRGLDFVAFGIALLLAYLSLYGSHDSSAQTQHVQNAVIAAWIALTLETAPMLLIGLAIAAAIQIWGSSLPVSWFGSKGPVRQAMRGALIGAPLPVCACGVLPITASLRQRGASAALVVAFLIATPELGVESFALTGRFLGWPFAVIRVVAAITVAIVTAVAVAYWVARDPHTSPGILARPSSFPPEPAGTGRVARFLNNLDELLFHVGPWTFAGLVMAAYVQAVLPSDALQHLATSGMDVIVITLFAIPSYVCAASATPLAAVLIDKGLSAGAALAALLLGPATNIATVGFLRAQFGSRAMLAGLAGLIISTWLFAYGVNLSPVPLITKNAVTDHQSHTYSALTLVATAMLCVLVLRSMWRYGIGGWFRTLGDFLALSDKDHDHASHAH
ncbi:MAG: permease [Myxococcales bacterium]|nr:permease [Myxococcales bacterium]